MSMRELTVLFADISGSTRLYQQQGDSVAFQQVAASLQSMKEAIEAYEGDVLRTVGDSVLASFTSTDAACAAAVSIQRSHARVGISVRVGFHVGQVIPDAGDVYGNAVNIAARVAEYAEANEICMTSCALEILSHDHRKNTHYLDTVSFKGVEKPVPVFRVHWQDDESRTVIVTDNINSTRQESRLALTLDYKGREQLVEVGAGVITLGRADDNKLKVDSESVSRNHAIIEMIQGRYVLSDTSTNGTYVVREGLASEFVRRESITLSSTGIIGLGFDPIEEPEDAIRYYMLKAQNFDESTS